MTSTRSSDSGRRSVSIGPRGKPIVANVSVLREMYEGEVADLDDDEATQTAAAIKTALHQLV